MRIALGVEYRGTGFSGWQSQRGARTVQDCVQHALGRVADHPVQVVTAGRTDSGVHATGQVAHFDTSSKRSEYSWTRGANAFLPSDIRVRWARSVPGDFHARFSALQRSYRYIIYCSPSRPAILAEQCTWMHCSLHLGAMREAARALIGRHDFSAFRAAGCQAKTPCREISRLALGQSGSWVWLDICADAFLQHMVRNIAGSLLMVGRGEFDSKWMERVLQGRDRTRAGPTARPNGLYLCGVLYPEHYRIPDPPTPLRFWS